ncbi:hypothetical protein DMENIID0001_124290 [Sergentomyia squamirostris]
MNLERENDISESETEDEYDVEDVPDISKEDRIAKAWQEQAMYAIVELDYADGIPDEDRHKEIDIILKDLLEHLIKLYNPEHPRSPAERRTNSMIEELERIIRGREQDALEFAARQRQVEIQLAHFVKEIKRKELEWEQEKQRMKADLAAQRRFMELECRDIQLWRMGLKMQMQESMLEKQESMLEEQESMLKKQESMLQKHESKLKKEVSILKKTGY